MIAWACLDDRGGGLFHEGCGQVLLALPFASVKDEKAHLDHVAGEQARTGGRLGQTAQVFLPLVVGNAHGFEQFVPDESLCRTRDYALKHLHGNGWIGSLVFVLARGGGDGRAELKVSLNLSLSEKAFGPVDPLIDFFLGQPDPRAHVHGFAQGDLLGPFGQLGAVQFFEKGDDGLVQVLHREVAQLHGPSQGHCGVGLGDRHLVVGIIGPTPPEIGLEEQFSFVCDQQAVRLAGLGILRFLGKFSGVFQNEFLVSSVFPERSDRQLILFLARGKADEGLLQIGKVLFPFVGDVLGVEIGYLRSQSVA